MNCVYCLYRVSTEKQTDENNEIQMQQIACRDYIKNQGWCLLKEISEVGVSGFKTEVAERESLQAILEDARNGLFDILLVYMFDRIGRRAQETCLIISILRQYGIRICSVKEGELNISDGGELLQFIRFWSAESESRHTQIRVDTRLKQLVLDGEFRGGAVPYGYNAIAESAQREFLNGKYELGKLSKHGQRLSIVVELKGKRDKYGKIYRFISGWMAYPNGTLHNNTPFSRFAK